MNPRFSEIQDPVERICGIMGFYRQNLLATGLPTAVDCRLALRFQKRVKVHKPSWPTILTAGRRQSKSCLQAGKRPPSRNTSLRRCRSLSYTVMEGGVMQARAHAPLEP